MNTVSRYGISSAILVGGLLAGETATTLPAEADVSLFLQKPFEEYTVTEGYLLLFLVLGFCMLVWKLVKGVF